MYKNRRDISGITKYIKNKRIVKSQNDLVIAVFYVGKIKFVSAFTSRYMFGASELTVRCDDINCIMVKHYDSINMDKCTSSRMYKKCPKCHIEEYDEILKVISELN